ncbi:MAG TPA: hypothetical protein VKC61_08950 [Pyrinomonadaceae bacterium]|nr:hypothetical protein [Pyrinomonadaceae bacterium]
MLTETFHSIVTATRNVFRNWPSMLLMAAVYASLLALLYLLVAIREATLPQVILTFLFAVTAPLLFFILQTMIASGSARQFAKEDAGETEQLTAGSLLKRSLTSFWKLILISLPLIVLAILIAYLLGRAQNHFGQNLNEPAISTTHPMAQTASTPPARPINWRVALFSTIRYLAFGLVLPLAAIHLWLATVRDGLIGAVRKIATLLSRAFAPQSVLIYIAGFIVFAVVPYFLLFRTTQSQHAWLELSFLVARLVVVFALTLLGWTITVRALGRFSSSPQPEPVNEAA